MFEKMNSPIFSILCIFVTEVRSKQALLFNLRTGTLEDAWHKDTSKTLSDHEYKYLAGCPASSPLEQKFNEDISLTKRSVFSRLIWRNQSVTGNDLDFCEKSYEPAMIYNPIEGEYKIGYELYFFKNETKIWNAYGRHYKTVNTKKLPYKIKNHTIFNGTSDSEFVIRYVDDYVIMFNFTNGYPTLGFYWVDVLSIKCSKNNKHVVFNKYGVNKLVNLIDKCGNYPLADEDLYSKKNQKKCLKDILVPPSLLRGKPDLSCGHPYGCLTPSQILPLWYFTSRSARLASCSHINLIPVWKSIADGNLRAVDLFVATIIKKLVYEKRNREVLFGVYGVLKMMVPGGSRKMYLSDAKRDRVVEIPKIIYRIIKFEAWNKKSIAVIVIHNDPSAVQDADRLCDKDDTLSGWEKITNDDPKTGLTYVCPMTPKLEIKLSVNYNNIDGLHLAAVPREGYSGEVYTDYKQKVVESIFERLKLKRYPYP